MRNSGILIAIMLFSCFGQTPVRQADAAKGLRRESAVQQLEQMARDGRDPAVVLRARSELARLYQRQGDWWGAIEQLQTVRKMAADDPEYMYQLGTVYTALSRWAFDRMQSTAPQSARTQQLMAEQLVVIGENERAIKALQDAIRADPALEGSHLALAMLYMRTGKAQLAAAEVDRELAIAPQSAPAQALKQALADRRQ